jgi:hypothetical protein
VSGDISLLLGAVEPTVKVTSLASWDVDGIDNKDGGTVGNSGYP